jgi:hypothetical protein
MKAAAILICMNLYSSHQFMRVIKEPAAMLLKERL